MPDNFDLEQFVPYRINSLAERVSLSLATVYASRFDISVAQWRILATLAAFPGLGATLVATRCNLDKVKVSRAVTDLESRGLTTRRRHERDARSSELHLSPSGKRLFKKIAPLVLDWEQSFLGGLTSTERVQLRKLLNKLDQGAATAGPRSASARSSGS